MGPRQEKAPWGRTKQQMKNKESGARLYGFRQEIEGLVRAASKDAVKTGELEAKEGKSRRSLQIFALTAENCFDRVSQVSATIGAVNELTAVGITHGQING